MNYGITTYIYGASPLSLKYTDKKLGCQYLSPAILRDVFAEKMTQVIMRCLN